MALDEPKDIDSVFDINGFQFIIEKDLLLEAKPIKVDFAHFGFQLDCTMQTILGLTLCKLHRKNKSLDPEVFILSILQICYINVIDTFLYYPK